MTETTGRTGLRPPSTAAVAARAVLAALLGAAVIFSLDHLDTTLRYGLAVLGVYLVLQAGVLAVFTTRLAISRVGRGLVLARAAVSLVGGVVALASLSGGLAALRGVEVWVFLLVGALEIVGGLRRTELPDIAGDAIVVGGLQVLVGVMLVILNPDAKLSVGVLGAWGAVVAVYLGISAANLVRRRRITA